MKQCLLALMVAMVLSGCDQKQWKETVETFNDQGTPVGLPRYAVVYQRRVDPTDSADQGRVSRFVTAALRAGQLSPEKLQELIATATSAGEAIYAHPVRMLRVTYPDSVVRLVGPWELRPFEQRVYDSLVARQAHRRP